MAQSNTQQNENSSRPPLREQLRTLRWQLILRTMLPLSLLVVTFAVVGQIGYTQVTESLARNRDTELAKLETARVADSLIETVSSLRQLSTSPVLLGSDPAQILSSLRDESLSQRFDYLLVTDASGQVVEGSDGTSGGLILDPSAWDYLNTQAGLPATIGPGKLHDGRDAIVVSMRYKDSQGAFAGIVEGGVAYGSQKLAAPFQDTAATAYQGNSQAASSGFSYLMTGDQLVLWHPDSVMVGTHTDVLNPSGSDPQVPGADFQTIGDVRYIVGHSPLNLGQLLTQIRPYAPWVQWYVVTQHRWQDVIAPVTAFLYLLVILALTMFLVALYFIARTANRLTVPVARLVSASQTLSAGPLKHRPDLLDISGPTEIEELARQFNSMAEQLQTSYSDLERKVESRTSELATANSELGRRLRESQTIQEVSARFAAAAGLDEVLRVTAASAMQALESEGCAIFLPSEKHPDSLEVAMVENIPGVEVGTLIGLDSSLTGLTFRSGQPQMSMDALNDPRVDPDVSEKAGTYCLLSVPLVAGGQKIGVLNTTNKRRGSGEFSEDDVRLLTLLANQAAVAMERARLYSEARSQVDTLETVNELSLSVTANLSLDETMTAAMEHIGKILGVKSGVLFLFDEKRRTLDITSIYNLHPIHSQVLMATPSLPVDEDYDRPYASVTAFKTQQPSSVRDMWSPSYSEAWRKYQNEAINMEPEESQKVVPVRSILALPLTVRERPLGAISLYFDGVLDLNPAEVRLFQSFANILALAVYNNQLVSQTSKLATVEERARLARELHDSVTQSLFSLNLTLKAARRNIEASPSKAERLLDNVQELAQGALAEMRALIFELRPQALANEGLESALEKHADSVKARSGLPVHLDIKGERRLPLDTEEALYQIAREALHNVVKHSHATEAWVTLDLLQPTLTMSIRDNGKGFDPEALLHDGGSHIGTSTMRERAAAIGGTLKLISAPDKGTEVRVTVDVPFPPHLDAGANGNGFADPAAERSLSANGASLGS